MVHDAQNFSMNFEPTILIIGLQVVSTQPAVYLPLSSSPGMTVSYFRHDAKRVQDQRHNGANLKKKSLEVSPNSGAHRLLICVATSRRSTYLGCATNTDTTTQTRIYSDGCKQGYAETSVYCARRRQNSCGSKRLGSTY